MVDLPRYLLMWGIFIVHYKEDGEDTEQCLWKSQSREKMLPLQFPCAGRGLKKEVLAAGGLRWRGAHAQYLQGGTGHQPGGERRWNWKAAALVLSFSRLFFLSPASSTCHQFLLLTGEPLAECADRRADVFHWHRVRWGAGLATGSVCTLLSWP